MPSQNVEIVRRAAEAVACEEEAEEGVAEGAREVESEQIRLARREMCVGSVDRVLGWAPAFPRLGKRQNARERRLRKRSDDARRHSSLCRPP